MIAACSVLFAFAIAITRVSPNDGRIQMCQASGKPFMTKSRNENAIASQTPNRFTSTFPKKRGIWSQKSACTTVFSRGDFNRKLEDTLPVLPYDCADRGFCLATEE